MLQVAQSAEGREDRQFSALLRTGSVSPVFIEEVRCPQFSIPSSSGVCLLELGACVFGRMEVGGVVADCIAHRRSQLPLDAEKSNFLPNCHRPRALPSQPTCACRSSPPPPLPHSCLPLPTPRLTPLPPSRSPVSGRTIYHVCSREGLGSGPAPAPGSLTKSSFSKADDRLWEQQLELRKEVSPLS